MKKRYLLMLSILVCACSKEEVIEVNQTSTEKEAVIENT